jgi:colanic acid/amylovoran biosynthesis glycosyltransferase
LKELKQTIAHCVRKSTQVRLSFIFNQIVNHQNYCPVIVYTANPQYDDSGFALLDLNNYNYYYSGADRNFFWKIIYRYFKQVSKRESRNIIKFLRQQNVKVLHLHFGTDASLYRQVIRFSGIPSVVSFYGYDCSSFPKRFMGLGKHILNQQVFRNATRILAMSPEMKTELVALGCPEEKIIVHYYGTDVNKYYTGDRITKSGDKITILTAGRLDEKKGHLFLLKALEQIKKETKLNLEWIIAGEGKQHEIISQQIDCSNLRKEVRMIGAYPYNSDSLTNLFAEADIYIQPSITAKDGDKEGIPGTLVEAMAAGLPVISTNHSGIPSIVVDESTGILVNEWDIEAMKKAILMLANDPELRGKLGKAAQKYALTELDLMKKEIELEEIYAGLSA